MACKCDGTGIASQHYRVQGPWGPYPAYEMLACACGRKPILGWVAQLCKCDKPQPTVRPSGATVCMNEGCGGHIAPAQESKQKP